MFVRMTRTRTHAYGVVTPSSLQPLLEAMLRAFRWLVSNVVSMLATIFNRTTRDWHTDDAHEDQFPTPNDPTQKEAHTFEPSFSGKRSARIPRIPVASTRGTTPYSLCALNQDAWDKPKHDAVVVFQTRSGPSAASPAKAGVQTPHGVRTSNSSAPRTRTGPPPSRGMRLATPRLSPRSSRRKSGSRAEGEPCPTLQLQSCARSTPVPGFRRLILSLSKHIGTSGLLC